MLFVTPCKKVYKSYNAQCCNYRHLLSEISSKFQSSMTILQYNNVWMQNISKADELKVSWDDNYCELIQKKCHYKSYHNNTKCNT
jgi:hypothetical protein